MSSYTLPFPVRELETREIEVFRPEMFSPQPVFPETPNPTMWYKICRMRQRYSLEWFLKRYMDVTLSSLALLCLAPLLLMVTLLIVLESPGNPIYKQKRIGLRGKEFDMFKFRSMVQDADAKLTALLDKNETNDGMFKMFDDPRITRVGKFIRKYSIDELPQLLNVLQGNMSLVGPRPPIEREVKTYKPWHFVRFATLPGLTGIWQTSGRSSVQQFDDVVRMDYDYIKNWNLLMDVQLILKTIPVVLLGKDAA